VDALKWIPDPELLLPDDRLPPARSYRAVSAFFGGDYMSLQALLKRRERVESLLNTQMADWQRAIAAPTWVMYSVRNDATGERLEIYAHICTPTAFLDTDRAAGVTDESRRARLVRRLEHAHRRGWLYGRWHSRTDPEGEYGVMHRAFVQRVLDEAEFLNIQHNNWRAT
jgi:hypothetical protein